MWQFIIPAAISAGASLLGSSAQSKAAKNAAAASERATADSNALQRYIFDTTRGDNEPFRQTGLKANAFLQRLYFGDGTGGPMKTRAQGDWAGYMVANPDLQAEWGRIADPNTGYGEGNGFATSGDPNDYAAWHYQNFGQKEGRVVPGGVTPAPSYAPEGSDPRFAEFYDTPDYQFRFNEGQRGLNAFLGAGGIRDSGSAMKAITRYGQDFASNEYGNFFNRLSNMAGFGTTANAANQNAGANYASAVGQNNMTNAARLGSSYTAQGNAFAQGVNGVTDAGLWAIGGIGRKRGWY